MRSAAVGSILGQVFSGEGRARRLHYWIGQVLFIIACRLIAMGGRAVQAQVHPDAPSALPLALGAMLVMLVALGAAFYASVCLVVRRWHDRGKSGWWALLGFVPVFGWLWQGIECGFLEGTLGPNRFGPSPKGITGVTYDPARAPA